MTSSSGDRAITERKKFTRVAIIFSLHLWQRTKDTHMHTHTHTHMHTHTHTHTHTTHTLSRTDTSTHTVQKEFITYRLDSSSILSNVLARAK